MNTLIESVWTKKPCDICQSLDITEWGHRIYLWQTRAGLFKFDLHDGKCNSCAYTYVMRVPTDQFLNTYYETAFYNHESFDLDFDPSARILDIKEAGNFKSKILEIGPGNGKFIKHLNQNGFHNVSGIDLLEMETDSNYSKAEGKYDIIVSYFVLEHILSPSAWLEQIKKHATKETVFIFEIPDFEKYPQHALNHEHFLYPSRKHIEALLAVNGFQILKFSPNRSRPFGLSFSFKLSESGRSIVPISTSDMKAVDDCIERYRTEFEKKDAEIQTHLDEAVLSPEKNIIIWGSNELALSIVQKSEQMTHSKPITIVDSAPQKIGKQFYNTSIIVKSPDTISAKNAYFIITAVSAYEVIRSQILKQFGTKAQLSRKINLYN